MGRKKVTDIRTLKEKYVQQGLFRTNVDYNLLRQIKPQSLFCYRPGSDYNLKALLKYEWLSDFEEFNDPFEGQLDIDLKHMYQVGLETDEELQEIVRKNPSSQEGLDSFFANNQDRVSKKFDTVRHSFYMKCFTTTNQSIPMWSYYANQHAGFCIEYDFDEIFENYGPFLYPVLYKKRYDTAAAIVNGDFNIVNEWLMTLVSKSEQWIHEDEWRIVLPKEAMPLGGRSKKGGCLVMPFPKAIYLGCRIPEKLEKAVREAICLEDIKVYKAKIDRTEYKLIFE